MGRAVGRAGPWAGQEARSCWQTSMRRWGSPSSEIWGSFTNTTVDRLEVRCPLAVALRGASTAGSGVVRARAQQRTLVPLRCVRARVRAIDGWRTTRWRCGGRPSRRPSSISALHPSSAHPRSLPSIHPQLAPRPLCSSPCAISSAQHPVLSRLPPLHPHSIRLPRSSRSTTAAMLMHVMSLESHSLTSRWRTLRLHALCLSLESPPCLNVASLFWPTAPHCCSSECALE